MLYSNESVQLALCYAYKCDCRRYEYHTVFWTVYRSNTFSIAFAYGGSVDMFVLLDFHIDFTADRRKYPSTEDSWR